MRSSAGGARSVFCWACRGAPGRLAQAGAPACPPSRGPVPGSSLEAPGSALFPSSTWNQLRADDFTSKTSRGSVSAVCLPDAFPFCWARGSTTIYKLPRLGAAESLSSGHRAARCCRCGPHQVRPRTSCRTHHPSPSLPCQSLPGTGGACWAQGSQDPWTG